MSNNPATLYLLSLSSVASRRETQTRLNRIAALDGLDAESYPWHQIDATKTLTVISQLESEGLSYSTINLYLSTIKGVAKSAWRANLLDGDALAKIKDIPNRKGSRIKAGQAISKTDVEKLIETCEKDKNKAISSRNKLIIMLGFFMGLRRDEIAKLKVSNIDRAIGELSVIGKGNKERIIPIPSLLMPVIEDWLAHRTEALLVLKVKSDYLFGGFTSNGKTEKETPKHMNGLSGVMIWNIIKDVCLRSGIDFNSLPSPHDMRRTAITNWLDKGEPRVAQALAGHGHIQTTMGYDRSELADKMRKVVE